MRGIADKNFEKRDLTSVLPLSPSIGTKISLGGARDRKTELLHYGKNAMENGMNTREASLGFFFTGS